MARVSRSGKHGSLNPDSLLEVICIGLSPLRSMHTGTDRSEGKLVKGMPVKDKEESRQLIGRGESSDLIVAPVCEVKDRKRESFLLKEPQQHSLENFGYNNWDTPKVKMAH